MSSPYCLDENVIYLNHAAVAPWPTAARDAVIAFAQENAAQGAYDYPRWMQLEMQLREKLRQLINAASSDDIALLKSTSEGLSFIAHGLDWQAGDNIVIPAEEFPSNRMVWQSLERYGVECRQVDIRGLDEPEAALLDAIDEQTRLLSCSSVQFASGLRMDLTMLGEACRQQNVLFCVDAIQSLGAIRFDLNLIKADFVVADGHKWMTGPEGLALFYCAPQHRQSLKLHEFGWHMMEHPHDFTQTTWRPADSAQRFECGSPNMLGTVALNAAVGVLLETGLDKVEQQVLANSAVLIESLKQLDQVEVLTPEPEHRHAGIVQFHCKGKQQNEIYQALMAQKIVCAARGNGVRFSPHFYTRRAHIESALNSLKDLIAG
jgi:selenocysteine lyase/cysteine desulfurase